MRARRAVLVAVSAGSWLAVLGGSAGAVEGFNIRALASGATVTFDQPGSPIPAEPTGEFHQAYSDARHETGPTGHALSSMLWPGSTAANAGSFFGFPNYPVRAEAFHPAGPPEQKQNEGGTFTMVAHSDASETRAATSSQSIPAGPAVEVGSLTSSVSSSLDGDKAVSTATATASNIVLFDGQVTIDSVVTKATATSDGVKGTVDGKTVVSGVTTAQGGVVEVEGSGITLGGQTIPVNPAPAESALEQLGVTMRVARPVDKVEGANASRTMGGLVVTFAPGSPGAPSGTTVTYNLAAVRVDALATQPPEETLAISRAQEASPDTEAAAAPASAPAVGVPTSLPPPVAPPPFAVPPPAPAELATAPASRPVPLPVAAVPLALGVIAGLGSALGGRLLGRLAVGALADGGGTVCPLGKQ